LKRCGSVVVVDVDVAVDVVVVVGSVGVGVLSVLSGSVVFGNGVVGYVADSKACNGDSFVLVGGDGVVNGVGHEGDEGKK